MHIEDTIAAVSTAHGTGGIGIIRISGDKAFDIGSKMFQGKKPFDDIKTHTINYGKIVDPDTGEIMDEVLLSKMKKPNTFTREDVVEINCHGGIVVLKRILELVMSMGARAAEPGEFTRRAFLNGRLDLSQAEAVIDLINSKTDESSKAAVSQLEGRLSSKIRQARDKLIELIAHIEVTVDYPEEDIEEITGQQIYSEMKAIKHMLEAIIKSFDKGRIIREGINIVIVGKPNVGKSSLMNELSGKNKAIVTDIPGTTRDIIEEHVNINGIPVRLVDTAGLRQTEDIVEKIGVEKAENALESADMAIVMLDASKDIDEENKIIIDKIRGKKAVILLNKIDTANINQINKLENELSRFSIIRTSMKEVTGIDELENEISSRFFKGEIDQNNEVLITNIRHKNLIDQAIASINDGCRGYESGMPLDCITIDIKNTAEYLGQITGESVSEDVLHEIFSRFCIGK